MNKMKDKASLQKQESLSNELENEGGPRRTKDGNCIRKGFLGTTLRDFRKKMNLSQTELAEKCSISLTQYNHYETGSHVPDVYKLIEICQVLQADPIAVISVALNRAHSAPTSNQIPIEIFENTAKAFNKKIESMANEEIVLN